MAPLYRRDVEVPTLLHIEGKWQVEVRPNHAQNIADYMEELRRDPSGAFAAIDGICKAIKADPTYGSLVSRFVGKTNISNVEQTDLAALLTTTLGIGFRLGMLEC